MALLVATGEETAAVEEVAVCNGTVGISVAFPVGCFFVDGVVVGSDKSWQCHVDKGAVAVITSERSLMCGCFAIAISTRERRVERERELMARERRRRKEKNRKRRCWGL